MLHRLGSSTLPVEVTKSVNRGLPMTTVQVLHRGWPSYLVTMRHAPSFGGRACDDKCGTVVTSVPGAMPRHSVVMEACPSRRNDVASCPSRGRACEMMSSCSGTKRDYNPRGGSGWPCTVVDPGASILILNTRPRGWSVCEVRPVPDLVSPGK
jgi:hypothetical protein